VRNEGAAGTGGAALSVIERPEEGKIYVRVEEEEHEVPDWPYVLIFYKRMKEGEELEVRGDVKAVGVGEYKIRLLGVHEEDGKWYMDDYVDVR